ncbi:MAG: NADH-quinone oxidoreductase subunit C, partial [Ignavibacteria bacterium]|nr:NADH-quinone oxidoreductase subunit C [Ignavibacteria bacterium]
MKENILEKLNAHFKDSVESINEYRGELTVIVRTSDIVRIGQFLRDDTELRFDSLRDICGADYYRPDDRFEVIYNLYSLKNHFRLRIKVRVNESDLHVPSVSHVWSTANWHER